MADDVGALFKNRKAKKGGKKFKSFSANKIVKQLEEGEKEAAPEASQSFRSSTAAEAVLKVNNLEQGQWVEEEETQGGKGSSLLGTGVSDIRDIATNEEPAKIQVDADLVEDDAEKAKLEFHLARAKAKAEADKKLNDASAAAAAPPKVEEEPKEKKVWRPRTLLSRAAANKNANAGGLAALKQLDNEQVFPSLGGASKSKPKTAATSAAWGQVADEVMESVLTPKVQEKVEPVYLGENFFAAVKFEGAKPGYSFKAAEKGLGYYWDGTGEGDKKEETTGEDVDPILKPSSTAWRPRRPMNAELPPAESDEEEEAAPTGGALEDDRFKPSAKAWRPRRPMNAELPPAESDDEETSKDLEKVEKTMESMSVSTPVVAPDAPAAAPKEEAELDDRFAGLKKKKKKKKPVAE